MNEELGARSSHRQTGQIRFDKRIEKIRTYTTTVKRDAKYSKKIEETEAKEKQSTVSEQKKWKQKEKQHTPGEQRWKINYNGQEGKAQLGIKP